MTKNNDDRDAWKQLKGRVMKYDRGGSGSKRVFISEMKNLGFSKSMKKFGRTALGELAAGVVASLPYKLVAKYANELDTNASCYYRFLSLFEEKGFDEKIAAIWNDIEYCTKYPFWAFHSIVKHPRIREGFSMCSNEAQELISQLYETSMEMLLGNALITGELLYSFRAMTHKNASFKRRIVNLTEKAQNRVLQSTKKSVKLWLQASKRDLYLLVQTKPLPEFEILTVELPRQMLTSQISQSHTEMYETSSGSRGKMDSNSFSEELYEGAESVPTNFLSLSQDDLGDIGDSPRGYDGSISSWSYGTDPSSRLISRKDTCSSQIRMEKEINAYVGKGAPHPTSHGACEETGAKTPDTYFSTPYMKSYLFGCNPPGVVVMSTNTEHQKKVTPIVLPPRFHEMHRSRLI